MTEIKAAEEAYKREMQAIDDTYAEDRRKIVAHYDELKKKKNERFDAAFNELKVFRCHFLQRHMLIYRRDVVSTYIARISTPPGMYNLRQGLRRLRLQPDHEDMGKDFETATQDSKPSTTITKIKSSLSQLSRRSVVFHTYASHLKALESLVAASTI